MYLVLLVISFLVSNVCAFEQVLWEDIKKINGHNFAAHWNQELQTKVTKLALRDKQKAYDCTNHIKLAINRTFYMDVFSSFFIFIVLPQFVACSLTYCDRIMAYKSYDDFFSTSAAMHVESQKDTEQQKFLSSIPVDLLMCSFLGSMVVCGYYTSALLARNRQLEQIENFEWDYLSRI